MPRLLTNNEALRASVVAHSRARHADGSPIERARSPEPAAPSREVEQVLEIAKKLIERMPGPGATQSPPTVVDTSQLVDLLTRLVENTAPRQPPPTPKPKPMSVRFRVLERDEKGRPLVFEAYEV